VGFIVAHWRGVRPRLEAFRLGLDHGMFCVGCCWAIMLLMFVVGTGSIGWMLALGAVMALEKKRALGQETQSGFGRRVDRLGGSYRGRQPGLATAASALPVRVG
ncbi:MAG TPA: DUF2182 domain-containing protein, partial [Methylomirabilota bacterium]|nr:DUF2182 domain-containing protein [Methylomirabilota bacterium]